MKRSQIRKLWPIILLVGVLQILSIQIAYSDEGAADEITELQMQAEDLKKAGYYSKAIPFIEKVLASQREGIEGTQAELARTIDYLGELHYLAGNYAEAEPLLIEALNIRKELFGPDHIETAGSYHHLGVLHILMYKFNKAFKFLSKSLLIMEKVYGKDHLVVAEIKLDLSRCLMWMDDLFSAEAELFFVLEVQTKILGNEHIDLVKTLNTFAWLYVLKGDNNKAIYYSTRAILICEKFVGLIHPDVAESLLFLGRAYYGRKQYEESIETFEKSLKISLKFFGPNHPDIGMSLHCLATTYFMLEDYDKAEFLFKETLSIYEDFFCKNHPRIAYYYSHIAYLNRTKEKYALAEDLYLKAINILQQDYEEQQTIIANKLIELGTLYFHLGYFEKSLNISQYALEILENDVLIDDKNIVIALKNIANIYWSIADYKKVGLIYDRILSIIELESYNENEIYVSSMLSILKYYYFSEDGNKFDEVKKRIFKIHKNETENFAFKNCDIPYFLGELYYCDGKFNEAKKYFQSAIAKMQDNSEKETLKYADTLYYLAFIHYVSKEYEYSNFLLQEAEDIIDKKISNSQVIPFRLYPHRFYCFSRLHRLIGNSNKAIYFAIKSNEYEIDAIDNIVGITSEKQKIEYIMSISERIHNFIDLVLQSENHEWISRIWAFETWINRKSIILDIQKKVKEQVKSSKDSELHKISDSLREVRSKLSKTVFKIPDNLDTHQYKQKKEEMLNEKENLELQLSHYDKQISINSIIPKADTNDIANVLPAGTVLIEFAKIKSLNVRLQDQGEPISFYRYIVFILHSGVGDDVSMIDLGDADKIEELISKYKREISANGNGKAESASATSKGLYNHVFRPLLQELGEVKEIFISPDGNLNLIPFEILQKPDDSFLIEEYTFNYLSSGRDLLNFTNETITGNKCLIMGAPDFDLASGGKMAVFKDKRTLLVQRSANLEELSFVPLHYAKAELEAIGKIIGSDNSEIYIGKDAQEETLLNANSPDIIHLATHGFFLSDQALPGEGRGFQTTALPVLTDPSDSQVKGKIDIENPLLRSGILLAGAKRSLAAGNTGYYDGIVTAEKILGMNLNDTKMVVLSACDTGLGDVKSGEGVFGLRRAFTQAGAKSIVMSLWKVPDKETKELMVQFYRNIKSGTMNRCQALRQAILKQKEIVRQRYGHDNPRYWGAFVFMGQP